MVRPGKVPARRAGSGHRLMLAKHVWFSDASAAHGISDTVRSDIA